MTGLFSDLEQTLGQMLLNGRISSHDADEVREFAAFLDECGPAPGKAGFDRERFASALRDHYPDDPWLPENRPHGQPAAKETP